MKKEIDLKEINLEKDKYYYIPMIHNNIISTSKVKLRKAEIIFKENTNFVIKEQVLFDLYYERKMPAFFKKNEKRVPFILKSEEALPSYLFSETPDEAIIKYSWIITNSLQVTKEEKIIAQTKLYEMSLRQKEKVEKIIKKPSPITPFIEFDIINKISNSINENI